MEVYLQYVRVMVDRDQIEHVLGLDAANLEAAQSVDLLLAGQNSERFRVV